MSRPRAPQPTSGPRSLAPREHGAYGQLVFPLTTALAAARPHAAAWSLATAAVLVFLAHEPWLVATGRRGRRATEDDGPRARRRLLQLGLFAAAFGLTGLALAPPAARLASLGAGALAVLVGWVAAQGKERTLGGELLASLAFASGAVPVALASGLPLEAAARLGALWLVAFTATTVGVRAVATPPSRRTRLGSVLPLPTLLALLPIAFFCAPHGPGGTGEPAALALVVASLGLVLARPSVRHMKRIGWSLVAASVAVALLVAYDTWGG